PVAAGSSRCPRFFFSSGRRHTRSKRDWSSDVCSSDLMLGMGLAPEWESWIYRALTFLVISCPCALVISIPLSFFAGIGGASKARSEERRGGEGWEAAESRDERGRNAASGEQRRARETD